MDDKILRPIRRLVDLDEMIAASQRPEAPLEALRVLKAPVAPKLFENEALLPSLPDVHPGRDKMRRLVELFEIDRRPAEIHGVHAAADVDAHDIRHRLVRDRHRRSDRTAFSGVDVRHDPDPASFREFVVAHAPDLRDRLFLDHGRIADRGIDFSFYFKHIAHFLFSFLKNIIS